MLVFLILNLSSNHLNTSTFSTFSHFWSPAAFILSGQMCRRGRHSNHHIHGGLVLSLTYWTIIGPSSRLWTSWGNHKKVQRRHRWVILAASLLTWKRSSSHLDTFIVSWCLNPCSLWTSKFGQFVDLEAGPHVMKMKSKKSVTSYSFRPSIHYMQLLFF